MLPKFAKFKMVVSKAPLCYPIRLVLHQHLNSHVAYPGIPPENSNHTQGQYQHLTFDRMNFQVRCQDRLRVNSDANEADFAGGMLMMMNFQVGCLDRLRVNSDADEALA